MSDTSTIKAAAVTAVFSATDTTATGAAPPGTKTSPGAGAIVASVLLVLIALLAFDPMRLVTATDAERWTLLFLAVCGAVVAYSPLRRHFENADAATFALAAAWFVIYALARRAGPEEGWRFELVSAPEIYFRMSYAARLAVVGAVVAAALNRTALSGFTRAALVAMLVATVLLLGNYMYLSQFFKPVGEEGKLDPVPLTHALLQLMEYGAVAVLCGVAAADAWTRRLMLKLMPPILLLLWARYTFGPVPAEDAEEAEDAESEVEE